ncbi:MAG: VCBS repeat-containing protein, partial [Deltaproteobacteria bacterium]|nr:VCBS repeat-containing protein [Deltaproteobacteria bacterium]
SQNFRLGLTAMAVGDVDGDGQVEFVLAAKHEIRVYRGHGRRLQKIAQMSTPIRYAIHAVTMADLNHNGRMEIYVSAADAKRPNSFILEWDGKKFAKLTNNQHFYIRIINIPGEGPVLAGQKAGFGHLLARGIFRLSLKNGQLVKGAKVPVNGVNLFDFSIVDLDGDGINEVVAISHGGKILVLRPSGKVKWISDDYYGGTTKYLGGIGFDDINKDLENESYDPERIYVPARIIIRDVNGDGRPDVIIDKNLSTASRIMSKYKSYPSGEIDALTWNGIGLTELWHTRKIDGYIADYNLGPIHKVPAAGKGGKRMVNGANLYVALVLRSGGIDILKDADSTVLTFPLRLPGSKSKGGRQ